MQWIMILVGRKHTLRLLRFKNFHYLYCIKLKKTYCNEKDNACCRYGRNGHRRGRRFGVVAAVAQKQRYITRRHGYSVYLQGRYLHGRCQWRQRRAHHLRGLQLGSGVESRLPHRLSAATVSAATTCLWSMPGVALRDASLQTASTRLPAHFSTTRPWCSTPTYSPLPLPLWAVSRARPTLCPSKADAPRCLCRCPLLP